MSTVLQGKKKRAELQLPTLHFIVADDWLDKLGKSFNVWLKLHTFVDRTDAERDYDRIPMSLEKVWGKLGMSKTTFFRMIRPLWEFGLIDLIEYEESTRNSQKPKNIIVYEYPFHEVMRKYQPLEKLRDWDKDYDSISKEAGKTGGRPKSKIQEETQVKKRKYTLVREKLDGFKNETVDGFENKTVTVSKIKPNNVSNISNNSLNSSNNELEQEPIKDLKDGLGQVQISNHSPITFSKIDSEIVFKVYQDLKVGKWELPHSLINGLAEEIKKSNRFRGDFDLDEVERLYIRCQGVIDNDYPDDYEVLSEGQFTQTILALYKKAEPIQSNFKALLESWFNNKFDFKKMDKFIEFKKRNDLEDLPY